MTLKDLLLPLAAEKVPSFLDANRMMVLHDWRIEDARDRGYTFVGFDGELAYYIRDGKGYIAHEDWGWCIKPSRDDHGRHQSAVDFLGEATSLLYAELNDVHLYPNQRRAWTLPLGQEC